MATVTLVNVQGSGSPFTQADTAATANTSVLRDAAGGILGTQVQGSELKSSGVLTLPPVTKAASFTLDATGFSYLCDATGGAIVATLPAAAAVAGRVYSVKKIDASGNAVTVTRAGSDTIDGATTKALSSQNAHATIQSDGVSGWWIIG